MNRIAINFLLGFALSLSFHNAFGQSFKIEFNNGDIMMYDLLDVGNLQHDLDSVKLFLEGGNTYVWNKTIINKYTFSASSLSIEDLEVYGKKDNMLLYPNPAENAVNINFTTYSASETHIDLIESTGKILKTYDLGVLSAGKQQMKLDLNMNPGSVLIRLRCADFSIVKVLTIK